MDPTLAAEHDTCRFIERKFPTAKIARIGGGVVLAISADGQRAAALFATDAKRPAYISYRGHELRTFRPSNADVESLWAILAPPRSAMAPPRSAMAPPRSAMAPPRSAMAPTRRAAILDVHPSFSDEAAGERPGRWEFEDPQTIKMRRALDEKAKKAAVEAAADTLVFGYDEDDFSDFRDTASPRSPSPREFDCYDESDFGD